MSRLSSRILLFSNVLKRVWKHPFRRQPKSIKRILIAHHLLLGDTIMLTPLVAKAREQFPDAEIVLLTPKAITDLYQSKPYGTTAVPYDPKDINTLQNLLKKPGYDLALIPGDNRYSWLAYALNSKWIKAFKEDKMTYKSWPIDELIPYSNKPSNWADMTAELINGPEPQPFNSEDWPVPELEPYDQPEKPFCVLHVGASNKLRTWKASKWRQVADHLTEKGYTVAWSAGKNETQLVSEIDTDSKYLSTAGKLSLTQLFDLIKNAELLICPDTGIAHIGKITGTCTITIFGQGSPQLFGVGHFWRNNHFDSIFIDSISCRDQTHIFKRNLEWIKRCNRNELKCVNPKCISSISAEMLITQINKNLGI